MEYAFIAQMVARDAFVWAAPLGGNTETALSDAIVNWDGKVMLIEFKRDENCLTSEYEKYVVDKKNSSPEEMAQAFFNAKAILQHEAGASAHGLIYGSLKKMQLTLHAIPYWDSDITPVSAMDWSYKYGVDAATLDSYCITLSGLRFSDEKSRGGSSSSGSYVLGVGKKGKCFAVELDEYINLRPELKKALNPDVGYESFGL